MTDDHLESLRRENRELRQQNAVKSDLISISAHQLRTSLSAMKWILKMFLDEDFGKLSQEQRHLVEKAFESDERMIRLVNEMLSINHTEDTLEEVNKTDVDIVKLLDEVVFDFIGESRKQDIELIFLKPQDDIPDIKVDVEKIRVVLQNLIENAIKYSEKGDKVFATITKEDGNVIISVRDSGIGIPKEEQENIFGKFFRAQNAQKKESVGSGLGLYTTKRIIERHEGKIWFESTPNGGTTFSVSLPL